MMVVSLIYLGSFPLSCRSYRKLQAQAEAEAEESDTNEEVSEGYRYDAEESKTPRLREV